MRREHNRQSSTLPPGYTQLQYIESTGTQYIETNIVADNGFIAFIVACYTTTQLNAYIVGQCNATAPYKRNGVQTSGDSSPKWMLGLGNIYPKASQGPSSNTIYTLNVSTIEGNSYLDVNGTRIITSTDSTGRSATGLYIFYDGWSKANNREKSKVKLYNLSITVNNVMHNLVPALREQDNKPGLYDTTDNVFYTNAGSGEFLYA